MGDELVTQSDDYSFSRFAQLGFFREENERLVTMAGLRPGQQVVDLACGPGEVSKLILDKVRGAHESLVIGVDMSSQALQQARQEFANVRDAVVRFVQARAEDLSETIKQRVDAVVFCNAIHLMSDKEQVLQEINETLKPGGTFAFNSTFYNGSQLPETDSFYRRWMMRALRILRSEYSMTPDREKVMARQQLTPNEYKELLSRNGFLIANEHVQTIDVPIEGWLYISTFADFVQGALPGVPIETGSEVLRKAIHQTFDDMNLTFVQRNWLEIVATRT